MIQDVLDIENGWKFSVKSEKNDVSVDNSLEAHRYYVRKTVHARLLNH